MSKIVEESNYAYEARDDLQNKMFSIRERMVKEAAEHEEQLLELSKLVEQEEMKRAEVERATKISSLGTTSDRAASTDPDQTRTRATKSRNSSAADQALMPDDDSPLNTIEDQIKLYEDFFVRLSPLASDLSDPVDIVNKIVGDEFQNFSRFNFINETNKEAEKLEAEIKQLKLEVDKCKKVEDTGGDKIRKKLLEGLQQQLEETEKKTEKFENKASQCLRVFSVKESIHEILDRLGDFRARDLSISELNENNIWRFLASISTALTPYLSGFINSRSSEAENYEDASHHPASAPHAALNKTNALLGLSDNVIEDLLAQSSLVQIDPPTTGYDSTDPEDQIYPFSSEEMRMKLTGTWTGLRDTMSPTRRSRLVKKSRPSTPAVSVA